MSQITIDSLFKEYKEKCNQYDKSLRKNKKYITEESYETACSQYASNVLANHKDSLTTEQEKEYAKKCVEYYLEQSQDFQKYSKDNNFYGKSSEGKYNPVTMEDIDIDPVVKNRHTYYRGFRGNGVLSDYSGTNSTYSPADIVASITLQTPEGPISTVLGQLQTISYSIYQDKAPVRTIGNMNAKDWVFGPRSIAGSLVFTVFNKHWMNSIMDQLKDKSVMKNAHFITDELPPFDITISFANEYGFDSKMAIYGVRIMNEGQVMSVNDIYVENTYQYVANDIDLMDSLESYQKGMHRRGIIIGSDGENDSSENKTPDPITGDAKDSSSENDEDEKEEKSEESLDNMTAEIEALKKKYEPLLDPSKNDPGKLQSNGKAYNEELKQIYKKYGRNI